ncbi:MAG: hypothetical protein K0V04_29270 [Deltaproteobacteria bacterium]|nr:hypothetical protein [Deltaproteobacteria bacterium]
MGSTAPGVYLRTGSPRPGLPLRACGGFWIHAAGALASESTHPAVTVVFEGVLLGDRQPGRDDAEVAAERFARDGARGLSDLDGFFRAIAVEPGAGRAWVVSDPLATRPLYLYRGEAGAAVAPSPAFFAAQALPMHLDRQALYEVFRLCHPVGARSLLRPVERTRPRTQYRIDEDGTVHTIASGPVQHHQDPAIDLDEAATRINRTQARIVDAVLEHPRLRGRAVHLPLTSGMDSRHLLGVLLARGTPPARLCHVHIDPREHAVVRTLARDLGLPLVDPTVGQLHLTQLLRQWIERCAGLVHIHQLYLTGVGQDIEPAGAVGFDGYLADLFLGFHRLPLSLARRRYVRWPMPLLFPDHAAREAQCLGAIEAEAAQWAGSDDFKASGSDAFNRGPWYTGGAFPLVDPRADYFAPAAHRDALEVFATVPAALLRHKRARLHMFRRDFPRLARAPTQNGVPLSQRSTLPDRKTTSRLDALWTELRRPHAVSGPQQWLRRVDVLRRAMARVVADGHLVREGVVPRQVVAALWRAHLRGAPVAFALMTLLSAEIAHRVCVAQQDPAEVTAWLLAQPGSPW